MYYFTLLSHKIDKKKKKKLERVKAKVCLESMSHTCHILGCQALIILNGNGLNTEFGKKKIPPKPSHL